MTGHRDGDMPHLPVAHSEISRERHMAFLISRHYQGCYRHVAPQDLSFTLSFRHQYLAVWLRELHHQRQFLSRSDGRTFSQASLHGCDGSLGQVSIIPSLTLTPVHALSVSSEATARHTAELALVKRGV